MSESNSSPKLPSGLLGRFTSYPNLVKLLTDGFIHLQRSRNRDLAVQLRPETMIPNAQSRIISDEINEKQERQINIILPVRQRQAHLKATAQALQAGIARLPKSYQKMVAITVAEIDEKPQHRTLAKEIADYYIFVPSKTFNKSYIMNLAADIVDAKVFLFHDIDLIVEEEWIENTINFILAAVDACGFTWVAQPIYERKIQYVNEQLTNKVFAGEVNVGDLHKYPDSLMVQPTWYQGNYPPGGTIAVGRDLFFAVQGYDPELFWGYSPEDKFFLDTCVSLSAGRFFVPPRDIGTVYHLWHPTSELTNEGYEHMVFARDISLHPATRNLYLWNKHVMGVWRKSEDDEDTPDMNYLIDNPELMRERYPAIFELFRGLGGYFNIQDWNQEEKSSTGSQVTGCTIAWKKASDWTCQK